MELRPAAVAQPGRTGRGRNPDGVPGTIEVPLPAVVRVRSPGLRGPRSVVPLVTAGAADAPGRSGDFRQDSARRAPCRVLQRRLDVRPGCGRAVRQGARASRVWTLR